MPIERTEMDVSRSIFGVVRADFAGSYAIMPSRDRAPAYGRSRRLLLFTDIISTSIKIRFFAITAAGTRSGSGSSHILRSHDNDERPAASTNGAGIAESAADVGWDTALRRGARNGRPTTPWTMARTQARARDRGSRILRRSLRNPLAQLQKLSELEQNSGEMSIIGF